MPSLVDYDAVSQVARLVATLWLVCALTRRLTRMLANRKRQLA
jgi:hypothetical protein